MNRAFLERLLDRIGEIDDRFLAEVEVVEVVRAMPTKRHRMVKYGAYGAAGLAIAGGAVVAYWKIRANRIAKSA